MPTAGAQRSAGFTLLEILVVVALVAMVAAGLSLRMASSSSVPLRASARTLSAELEFAAQRALATGRAQRWVVNLDEQVFRIEEHAAPRADTGPLIVAGPDLSAPIDEPTFAPIEHSRYGSWHELDELEIGIDAIEMSGEVRMQGEVAIAFAPDGGADPAVIWLLDTDSREVDIAVTAFTGEVETGEVIRRE